ncbi:hypothetical protein BDV38DRAFT_275120 [Aspergillus pseudotamarii]|uniref:Uncharacterized protein n=1 Tax=Aspergillus pseudotamarii TaxID=132259 RepID=A0A5N6SFF2_ASPPS|nr:uncharacterized protein BDV38DRAFT_275120 [Aspergillus pseudotamarii]KAE8132440.1 hypothetical protein BDV38DRAFT_275120 [Aspergillus pseudotamarii]
MDIYTDDRSTHTIDWRLPENYTITNPTLDLSSPLSTMGSNHPLSCFTDPEMATANVLASPYSSTDETMGLAAYTPLWRDSEQQVQWKKISCPFYHDPLSIRSCEWCGQQPSILEGNTPGQWYHCYPLMLSADEYENERPLSFPISSALDCSPVFGIDARCDPRTMTDGNQSFHQDQTLEEEVTFAPTMIEPYCLYSTRFGELSTSGWPVIPLPPGNGN